MAEKRLKVLWGVAPFLTGMLLVGVMMVLFGALQVASANEPSCGDVLCEEQDPLTNCGVPCDAEGQCPAGLQCDAGGYCWDAAVCPPPAPDQPPPTPRDEPRLIL